MRERSGAMSVMKEMQFPVSIRWRGGGLTYATPVEETHPSKWPHRLEFHGGLPGYWSPEDLLVTAVASCFALMLAAVAERWEAPLLDAKITATGHMGRRDDGHLGFTVIEINAALETVSGGEASIRLRARDAGEHCLIAQALYVPVHLAVDVASAAEVADRLSTGRAA